jgi:hypothetical protein
MMPEGSRYEYRAGNNPPDYLFIWAPASLPVIFVDDWTGDVGSVWCSYVVLPQEGA